MIGAVRQIAKIATAAHWCVPGGLDATHLPDITRLLAEYDEPLSGQAATAYSVLFDAVEAAQAEPNA